MKQFWKNWHRHRLMAVRAKMPKANWMVCAVQHRAAALKTVAARDAADNASKHAPSVPLINALRDK